MGPQPQKKIEKKINPIEEENLIDNKEDILNEIDKENQNIFSNLCHTAEKLEISLDKLNTELISHKDLNIFKKLEKNKHKLLSKVTKTINRINYITVELNSIGDIYKSLKLSNCENLPSIEKKFKYASDLSPEIIEIIQNYIKEKKINLSIFILSQ